MHHAAKTGRDLQVYKNDTYKLKLKWKMNVIWERGKQQKTPMTQCYVLAWTGFYYMPQGHIDNGNLTSPKCDGRYMLMDVGADIQYLGVLRVDCL